MVDDCAPNAEAGKGTLEEEPGARNANCAPELVVVTALMMDKVV
jgi:hypothetical protein